MSGNVIQKFFRLDLTASNVAEPIFDVARKSTDLVVQSSPSNTEIVELGDINGQFLEIEPGSTYSATDFFKFGEERSLDLSTIYVKSSVTPCRLNVVYTEVN